MAATTIGTTGIVLTNDTGTAASPNGDGTVLNAALWALLLTRINECFSGAFTVGGVLGAEGFGSHTFSAGGTGVNAIVVRNTTAGTTNYAAVVAGNNASAGLTRLLAMSSTYTSDGFFKASGSAVEANGSGGLSIGTSDAAGVVRLYTNTRLLRTTWATDGTLQHDYGLRLTGMYAQAVSGNTELSGSASTNVVCRVTSATSSPAITGALGADGQVLVIKNVSGAAVTLTHESGSSSPALRFKCPGNANLSIDDGDGVICIYSGDDSRWLVIGV